MTAPALAALMFKPMINLNFGIFSYFAQVLGFEDMRW